MITFSSAKNGRRSPGRFAKSWREWRATSSPASRLISSAQMEGVIAAVWRDLLRLPEVGLDDNFFDLRRQFAADGAGLQQVARDDGHVVIGARSVSISDDPLAGECDWPRRLRRRSLVTMTGRRAGASAAWLRRRVRKASDGRRSATGQSCACRLGAQGEAIVSNLESPTAVESIAVIGLNGRFPGARNVEEFWTNLKDGVETISRFSDAELKAAGRRSGRMRSCPGFVNAGSVLTDIDHFDAVFFGYSARDAECIDPQQRLFLESAWECLEAAGYDPEVYPGLIGVFGGSDMSSYIYQLYSHMDPLAAGSSPMALIGNDKDYLTTQVSYKLNLKGPSMAIQTSCSTSLVAVCVACQNLWSYGCDMALAGGVADRRAAEEGLFLSGGRHSVARWALPHRSTPKARAPSSATASESSLLKRLSDAIADGDTDPCGDQGRRAQQRRLDEGRLHGAERRPDRRRSSRWPRRWPASIPRRSATWRRTAPPRCSAIRSRWRRSRRPSVRRPARRTSARWGR